MKKALLVINLCMGFAAANAMENSVDIQVLTHKISERIDDKLIEEAGNIIGENFNQLIIDFNTVSSEEHRSRYENVWQENKEKLIKVVLDEQNNFINETIKNSILSDAEKAYIKERLSICNPDYLFKTRGKKEFELNVLVMAKAYAYHKNQQQN